MTALLTLGALLTLAQAAAGWALWRRVRALRGNYAAAFGWLNSTDARLTTLDRYIANVDADAKAAFGDATRRLDALDAHAALVGDDLASLEKRTNDAFAREESALAALRADLEQHRKGSRHRRKP